MCLLTSAQPNKCGNFIIKILEYHHRLLHFSPKYSNKYYSTWKIELTISKNWHQKYQYYLTKRFTSTLGLAINHLTKNLEQCLKSSNNRCQLNHKSLLIFDYDFWHQARPKVLFKYRIDSKKVSTTISWCSTVSVQNKRIIKTMEAKLSLFSLLAIIGCISGKENS